MGIKGLRFLLKKKFNGDTFEEQVPFNYFENKTIVIDASIYICNFKVIYKQGFEEAFIDLIVSLLESKITPIFIFDGTSPVEKSNEKKKRSDKKDAQNNRIDKLENDLKIYYSTKQISEDLWDISSKVFESKLLPGQKVFALSKVSAYVQKLRSNVLDVTNQDFMTLRNLLHIFGIPQYTAQGEGEMLCSLFVKNGLADAVLTKDTDVLASGTHTMLCNINLRSKKFTMIKLEKILEKLNLDCNSFLDLCIMCGTDFNDNVPSVGPIRSLDYIEKHKTLENISEHLNTQCLSYPRTRDLFTKSEVCPTELQSLKKINYDSLSHEINEKGLKISIDGIQQRLQHLA